MDSGYIYILKNPAFGANVLKIGLTRRTPNLRAREIYQGSTGVPLPFDIALAFSIANCTRAEKEIHTHLKAFRLNKRREFFRIPLQTAVNISLEVCDAINNILFAGPTKILEFPPINTQKLTDEEITENLEDITNKQPIYQIDPRRIIEGPMLRQVLVDEQYNRAKITHSILQYIHPISFDVFLDGFMRDENPGRELRIWENIAKAYLTLDHADDLPVPHRREIFSLLLMRSLKYTEQVLDKATLKNISYKNAKRLLDAYALPPRPFTIKIKPAK